MTSSKRDFSDFTEFYDWLTSQGTIETPILYTYDAKKNIRQWRMRGRLISPNKTGYGQNWDLTKDNEIPIRSEYLEGSDPPPSDFQYWIESSSSTGKITRYPPSYSEEKNTKEGKRKKNYRNIVQQGLTEMRSKFLKHKEDGAQLTSEELDNNSSNLYWPMLTTKFKEDYESIVYPCYAQPKLNGLRCIMFKQEDIIAYSRDLKPIPGIKHIRNDVSPLLSKSLRLDGEIFEFDTPLNVISGWARNEEENNNGGMRYFIFDLFDTENLSMTFEERLKILQSWKQGDIRSFPISNDKAHKIAVRDYQRTHERFIETEKNIEPKGKRTKEQEYLKDEHPFQSFDEWDNCIKKMKTDHKSFDFYLSNNIAFVPTLKVSSKHELLTLYYAALDAGFEGLIARNADGVYYTSTDNKTSENRSLNLQKLKPWYDEEFEIVGYTSGKGRNQDAIIWICKTRKGNEFNCDPKGMSIEERKKLYNEFQKDPSLFNRDYKGQMMTVQYEEINKETGKPQRAKALGVRFF